MGYSISEVRMDDSQVVGEEQNVHGREILAREVRNNETQGCPANRHLPGALLVTTLNSNPAKGTILRSPSWSRCPCLNLLGRKVRGRSNVLSESFVS